MQRIITLASFSVLILCSRFGFGQKPAIDFATIQNFPKIDLRNISNNGQYVLYVLNCSSEGRSLTIVATDSSYSKVIKGSTSSFNNVVFSENSRKVIFNKGNDTLCILSIPENGELNIPDCKSFFLPKNNAGEWIACLLKNDQLIVYNYITGVKRAFGGVKKSQFSNDGKRMVAITTSNYDSSNVQNIKCMELESGKEICIWKGEDIGDFQFDNSNNQLVFAGTFKRNLDRGRNIYLYKFGEEEAKLYVNNSVNGLDSNCEIINDGLRFSSDNKKIIFKVQKIDQYKNQLLNNKASVDIWHYKDQYVQSDQLSQLTYNQVKSYLTAINLADRTIVKLEDDSLDLISYLFNKAGNENFLLSKTKGESYDQYRLQNQRPDIWLTNTNTGKRSLIIKNLYQETPLFSPSGKYVYWYDWIEQSYYTYNLTTGAINNLSKSKEVALSNEENDHPSVPNPYGIAGWIDNDESILVYDKYDVWKLNPDGNQFPVNITKGYGRKNKIILRLVYFNNSTFRDKVPLEIDSSLLLCAFDEENKKNGFYKIGIGKKKYPTKLTIDDKVFYFPEYISFVGFSNYLIKARESNTFLLIKEGVKNYPNLYVTNDFCSFTAVSHLEPHVKYNWLTNELLKWKTTDGKQSAGILYKPENFDSTKKYPLIFLIYERFSPGLNKYLEPSLCYGPINIPLFVSNGYLVFCPDIYYKIGNVGQSVYDYILSAVKMLSKKSYVNVNKLGIQGHSMGGFEVNYLITRTNSFAAAASASGISNLVSCSGGLILNKPGHAVIEQQQIRMGVSLWQDKHAYLSNSPIFSLDKVSTPLLLMNNRMDNIINWLQGVEMFTGLRRMRKKVWMLQYDNGAHTLFETKDMLDYSIRLFQFFNYYLKDSLPPAWMTKGVPAKLKGTDDGLKLDSNSIVE